MPNEFTLTLPRFSGHDNASTGTWNVVDRSGTNWSAIKAALYDSASAAILLFGFGVRKLMFGGIIFFSNAKTILMILVIPDAPSECPTFGFT